MTDVAVAMRVVVMGVSGCGKSTIGRALAARLSVPFVEGDELHPAENVALMRAGTPLTDADRAGWLDRVAGVLSDHADAGVVVTCSALKRSYRDRLRTATPQLRFVHLHGSRALLERRMAERSGHYMPASLLQSQLDALEPPGADEAAVAADIAGAPAAVVAAVMQHLTQHQP